MRSCSLLFYYFKIIRGRIQVLLWTFLFFESQRELLRAKSRDAYISIIETWLRWSRDKCIISVIALFYYSLINSSLSLLIVLLFSELVDILRAGIDLLYVTNLFRCFSATLSAMSILSTCLIFRFQARSKIQQYSAKWRRYFKSLDTRNWPRIHNNIISKEFLHKKILTALFKRK